MSIRKNDSRIDFRIESKLYYDSMMLAICHCMSLSTAIKFFLQCWVHNDYRSLKALFY